MTPSQGVGIQPLDVSVLVGSQRVGIVGLPTCHSHPAPLRRPGVAPARGPVSPRAAWQWRCGPPHPPPLRTVAVPMSLLVELRNSFPIISVFSGSESDAPFYGLCIPKLFINSRVSKRGLKQFGQRSSSKHGK